MSNPQHDFDASLSDLCHAQADRYDKLHELAQTLVGAFAAGDTAEDTLRQLDELLGEVAAHTDTLQQAVKRWDAAKQKPSARLRSELNLLESKLKRVLESVLLAEESARQAKARVLPQLEQHRQGRQMLNAYAAASRTS